MKTGKWGQMKRGVLLHPRALWYPGPGAPRPVHPAQRP